MPNWCSCDLVVLGPKKDLEKFVNASYVADPDLAAPATPLNGCLSILAAHVPMPKFPPSDAGDDWYNWAIANWGTKWGDCHTTLGKTTSKSQWFHFDTAWGPPEEGLATLSKKWPTLRFTLRYYECGMGFQGRVTMKNGWADINTYDEKYRGRRGG